MSGLKKWSEQNLVVYLLLLFDNVKIIKRFLHNIYKNSSQPNNARKVKNLATYLDPD